MTSRREARRTAIDILYQADVTSTDPAEVLASWTEVGRMLAPFTAELVTGVAEHLAEIDRLLDARAEGWAVERMTVVDRAILRVAVFELSYLPDVPPSVAISEAVQAASDLSAEAASGFVNGVLGRIAGDLRPAADGDAAP